MPEIIHMAASDNPTARTKAFTFLLDNLNDIYPGYNPQDFWDLPFVPAVLGSEKMLAKPSEVRDLPPSLFFFSFIDPWQVCADPKWTALGFAIVDPMLPDEAASKLRLNLRPQDADLVTLLARSPPEDETTARKWLELFCDCVSGRSLSTT